MLEENKSNQRTSEICWKKIIVIRQQLVAAQ